MRIAVLPVSERPRNLLRQFLEKNKQLRARLARKDKVFAQGPLRGAAVQAAPLPIEALRLASWPRLR